MAKKEEEKIGLHIGCGSNIIEGWLNTDISPRDERVRFQDATQPFPFESNTFKFVFCEHLFEHLPYYGGLGMLNECHRVLKPDGVFRISLPTLNFLVDLFVNKDKEENKDYVEWSLNRYDRSGCINGIKGSKACFVINNFYRLWGHKMIYDEDTIIEMLKNAGFNDVKKVPNNDSEYPELKDVNGHGQDIGEKYNEIETTTFEGKKLYICNI